MIKCLRRASLLSLSFRLQDILSTTHQGRETKHKNVDTPPGNTSRKRCQSWESPLTLSAAYRRIKYLRETP